MANLITSTYQLNGSKLFTVKVDIVGDGTGEISASAIITSAALTGNPATFKIRAIQWDCVGFDTELLWDATTDVHAFSLPGGVSGGIRFSDTGAHLVNNAGAGITGSLNLTTAGLGATGRGTIIIEGQH
jgi:hypothetical protein